MGKFVEVDEDLCIACGLCGSIAPEVFEYDDAGISFVAPENSEVTDDVLEDVLDAEEGCPVEAISVKEK